MRATHHSDLLRATGLATAAILAISAPGHGELIHHWTLDGHPNDLVGGSLATVHGTATYAPGVYGEAFVFDGSTHLETDYVPVLGPGDSMSISVWIRLPAGGVTGDRDVLGLERSNHQEIRLVLDESTHEIRASFRDDLWDSNMAVASMDLVDDGGWHHLAAVRDKALGGVFLYVDGVRFYCGDTGGAINQTSPRPLDIGADNNSTSGHINPWLGEIDDVRFFDHALSELEITVLRSPGLVHYWPFDGHYDDVVDGEVGTPVGSIPFVPGRLGDAITLDGSVYLETTLVPVLGAGDSMAISVWIKLPAGGVTAYRDILGLERTNHQEIRLVLDESTHEIRASFRDDDWESNMAVASIDLVDDGRWHHLAAVRDKANGNIVLYVDCTPFVGEDTGGAINQTAPRTLDIGADNNSSSGHINRWIGEIDELRIYDRALGEDEIAALGCAPSLMAYGFGVSCPCGNDDPGAGCANSTGSGARLFATGTTGVTADDLELHVEGLPAPTFALVYMGPNQASVPFGDGLRAVSPGPPGGFCRFPVHHAVGGSFAQGDVVALSGNFGCGPIQPGQVWNFQGYYRDNGGPCGSGFNLTNGLCVIFGL